MTTLAQPRSNLTLIAKLAAIPGGWYSNIELAWTLTAPCDDYLARGAAKAALAELFHFGLVDRLKIRHNKNDLVCYLIDPATIRDALETWLR